ncbi:spore coat protein [Paenibacillus radicis (ex Xue et al. 2023)]|uniref:Spore coat protein n=1 Tax=Paenibacillus radicis (ex Xue et al. 2023) TaxID=2972489 RepID=A0ABT1YQL9_9BACL|nr:spore coat protein [Paenibacillus radicis (ex Xue et al. 2023)]MCR8635481.1 spore coat protein [Paenibacillus radicis (ex Xue et al. 2023)]
MQTSYSNQVSTGQMPSMMNHGGHEMFDSHEILSSFISLLDQYVMFEQFIQDEELKQILYRQHRFITDLYNITVDAFSTGRDPSHPTHSYKMNQNNQVIYGMQQTAPKKPMMSIQEINGQGISAYMLGLIKSTASLLAMTSLEITNPVLRRMMADSVPNFIEMGYELFLYQNKRHYYQVPQLAQQDMQQMRNSYAPSPYLV